MQIKNRRANSKKKTDRQLRMEDQNKTKKQSKKRNWNVPIPSCGVDNQYLHTDIPTQESECCLERVEWSYRESASEKKTQQKSI